MEVGAGRPCPTHREIAAHFGYSSSYAAACHVRSLVKKNALIAESRKARALHLFDTPGHASVAEIPVFGSIPAGFSEDRWQELECRLQIDTQTLGFKPTQNTFALRVAGDSMIGRHICDGDIAVLEHGREPRHGQIVAALVDRESTLKTFVLKGGKAFLRAENPIYPNLIPSDQLMIQGVVTALIRRIGS